MSRALLASSLIADFSLAMSLPLMTKLQHASPYVADLLPDYWRVVVPVPGRLSPKVHCLKFGTRRAAELWLDSNEGRTTVASIQTTASTPKSQGCDTGANRQDALSGLAPSSPRVLEVLSEFLQNGGPSDIDCLSLRQELDAEHRRQFTVRDGLSERRADGHLLNAFLSSHARVFRTTATMQGFAWRKGVIFLAGLKLTYDGWIAKPPAGQ